MEINWYIIAPVGCLAVVLIMYLIRQNQKDKKELEKKLNEDYKRQPESELNDDR